ncbi:zf-TFIIB domain-containing protein [Candidatus Sumerlaeota bacterium]|nr:zf-TFIIB domain-containing protein [Candidatus Sumerlaeota bacterium]
MQCTSCNSGTLRPNYLDAALLCHTCDHCGGHWLYLGDYLRWLEQNRDFDIVNDTNTPVQAVMDNVAEATPAMLCPYTGVVMLKYRISKDLEHRLDLSPSINGIWLAKGKWELLKREGLAGRLNEIFTSTWQRQIKEGRTRDVMEQKYIEEFGAERYARLKQIRAWLDAQSNRRAMLAYLLDDDPFSV